MIDSAGIQQAVQSTVEVGTSFLPGAYKLLAPIISTLITLITAAIIRHVEKREIQQKNDEVNNELLKRAIEAESKLINQNMKNESSATNTNTN